MPSARAPLPMDLVALVLHDGRRCPNEAITWDRIGKGDAPGPLETAVEQWLSFATGRHTWVNVKGRTLRGLASARIRGSRQAWEIDCLIDAAEDDEGVLINLLDRVVADAGRARAEKVFLRVDAASAALDTALRCGFSVVSTEGLYYRPNPAPVDPTRADPGWRRRAKTDAYALYRLYNAAVPESVRRVEAATLAEWLAAQERLSVPRRTHQFVVERDGRVLAWARTAVDGDVGRFQVMAAPGEPEVLDRVLHAAILRLARASALYTLAPLYDGALVRRLEDLGFGRITEFAVLARRTAETVKAPRFVPANLVG